MISGVGRPKVKEKRVQKILLTVTPQEVQLIIMQIKILGTLLDRPKGIHAAEYMRHMALYIPTESLFQTRIVSTTKRIPKWAIATTIEEYIKIKQKAKENNLSINEYIIRSAISDFRNVEWDFIKKRK